MSKIFIALLFCAALGVAKPQTQGQQYRQQQADYTRTIADNVATVKQKIDSTIPTFKKLFNSALAGFGGYLFAPLGAFLGPVAYFFLDEGKVEAAAAWMLVAGITAKTNSRYGYYALSIPVFRYVY